MRLNSLLRSFALPGVLALSSTLCGSNAAVTQTKTASGASLEETLNWLTDFLPKATGAPESRSFGTFRTTARIESIKGCSIRVYSDVDAEVNGRKSSHYSINSFSLGDIDSKLISSHQTGDYINVLLVTRGVTDVVQEDSYVWDRDGLIPDIRRKSRTSSLAIQNFSELASADRAANALRHAAELCAVAQPF